ncbi:hypothetical protein RUM43_000994 [Polyplax serrata]|uniref:Uncharacterized protein n=1 Tax=Polyplax serrata TaxID=468196 RepID=A0AAN8XPX8_POLSC
MVEILKRGKTRMRRRIETANEYDKRDLIWLLRREVDKQTNKVEWAWPFHRIITDFHDGYGWFIGVAVAGNGEERTNHQRHLKRCSSAKFNDDCRNNKKWKRSGFEKAVDKRCAKGKVTHERDDNEVEDEERDMRNDSGGPDTRKGPMERLEKDREKG